MLEENFRGSLRMPFKTPLTLPSTCEKSSNTAGLAEIKALGDDSFEFLQS